MNTEKNESILLFYMKWISGTMFDLTVVVQILYFVRLNYTIFENFSFRTLSGDKFVYCIDLEPFGLSLVQLYLPASKPSNISCKKIFRTIATTKSLPLYMMEL